MHSHDSNNSRNISIVLRQFKPKSIKIRQVDIQNRNLVKNHIKNLIGRHTDSTTTDVLSGLASISHMNIKQDSYPIMVSGFQEFKITPRIKREITTTI